MQLNQCLQKKNSVRLVRMTDPILKLKKQKSFKNVKIQIDYFFFLMKINKK